jgi:hypothetical protein
MDATTIAKETVKFLLPFIAKNKAVKKITSDISEASSTSLLELWEWMKPLFIEEFEQDGELEEDATNEAIVAREVKKKVAKADASELAKLQQLLTQLQSDEAQGKLPKTNTINVTGNQNITLMDVQGRDVNINTPNDE